MHTERGEDAWEGDGREELYWVSGWLFRFVLLVVACWECGYRFLLGGLGIGFLSSDWNLNGGRLF